MRDRWVYAGLGLVASSIFLGHYALTGQAVYGDGIGYYAHVRSWVIDGDRDCTNEYRHIYSPENNNILHPQVSSGVQIVASREGKAINYFSSGTSLVWWPLFQVMHFFYSGTGYEDKYQIGVGLFTIGVMIGSLRLAQELMMGMGMQKKMVQLGLVSGFLGTNLLFYGAWDVINSHAISFGWSVGFWYLLQKLLNQPKSIRLRVMLGMVTGMMANTRIQDGLALGIWFLAEMWLWKKKHTLFWRGMGLGLIVFGLVFAITICHWSKVYGNWWEHKYLTVDMASNISRLTIADGVNVLFSVKTGLVGRFPLMWLALGFGLPAGKAGIWGWVRRKWSGMMSLMGLFFLAEYGVVVLHGGWRSQGYGGRLFISSLPLFLSGWTLLLETWAKYRGGRLMKMVIAGCVLFNIVSMGHFLGFEKRTQEGGEGTERSTLRRLEPMYTFIKGGK